MGYTKKQISMLEIEVDYYNRNRRCPYNCSHMLSFGKITGLQYDKKRIYEYDAINDIFVKDTNGNNAECIKE